MQVHLFKHRNVVVSPIPGRSPVKYTSSPSLSKTRLSGVGVVTRHKYHLWASENATSCPCTKCPWLFWAGRGVGRCVALFSLHLLPSRLYFLLSLHLIWFLIHSQVSGDCSSISVSQTLHSGFAFACLSCDFQIGEFQVITYNGKWPDGWSTSEGLITLKNVVPFCSDELDTDPNAGAWRAKCINRVYAGKT